MQSFQLPTKIHDQLDQINRYFFWNKNKDYKPLIGWDKICQPKMNGGLGIRKSKDMNDALQMKLLWKILAEPNNIWVKIITQKYLKQSNLLNYNRGRNSKVSWQWKNLYLLKD